MQFENTVVIYKDQDNLSKFNHFSYFDPKKYFFFHNTPSIDIIMWIKIALQKHPK